MHIAQEQIDYINNKYSFLDKEAYKALVLSQYNLYLYGGEKSKYTDEAKTDIRFILDTYPDFNSEEALMRLTCNFEALFKRTFPQLVQELFF